MWPDAWKIDDSLFGLSRSVEKVIIHVRNHMRRDRELYHPIAMRAVQEFPEKFIKRILKKDGFRNETVLWWLKSDTDEIAR